MRNYLLVFFFLISIPSQAIEVKDLIDSKIKMIYKLKSKSEKIKNIETLHEEVKKLKENSKLSDADFYIATDFLNALSPILTSKDYKKENCFNSKVELMSNFGIKEIEQLEKELPFGAKKGFILLSVLCR
ncbi:putative exported protein [Halobacteriovorax marinus SJ]|uniref:Exported protein n=1 Tax=Halobacteriovorax marinus (strain ATCC BAA-682 / DSM 15412 / SJ) TaxID=862908 RepID=E1WZH8_HALMS|nr:hypothetical protein [Halobacteriovorax marinus]CBW26164.1 putative exported protein [Halobacteriovorax marinus SJ]